MTLRAETTGLSERSPMIRLPGGLAPALGANMVLALVSVVTGTLLARGLGVVGRGQLAAVQLPALIIASLAGLGMHDALVYFVRSKQVRSTTAIVTASSIAFLTAATAGAIGLLFVPMLLGQLPDDLIIVGQVAMILPFATSIAGMGVASVRALGYEARWNLLRLTPGLLWILVILGSRFFSGRDQLLFLVLGSILSNLCLGLLVFWRLVRVPRSLAPLSRGTASRMLRYGLPLAVSELPKTANSKLDQIVLVAAVTPRELGLYVAAVAWSSISAPLTTAFGIAAFPRVAEATPAQRYKIARSALGPAALLAAISSLVAAISAPLGMRVLFGAAFAGAVTAAQILSVAAGLFALSSVCGGLLQGFGQTRPIFVSEIAGLLATVPCLALLLPRFGIVGAAVASLVGYGLTAVWRLGALALLKPGRTRSVVTS